MQAATLVALGEPDAALGLLEAWADGASLPLHLDCRYPELRALEEDPRYREIFSPHDGR